MLLSNQPHFNNKLYQVVIIMGFWLYRKKAKKATRAKIKKMKKGKKENWNKLLISYSDGSNFDNKIYIKKCLNLTNFNLSRTLHFLKYLVIV